MVNLRDEGSRGGLSGIISQTTSRIACRRTEGTIHTIRLVLLSVNGENSESLMASAVARFSHAARSGPGCESRNLSDLHMHRDPGPEPETATGCSGPPECADVGTDWFRPTFEVDYGAPSARWVWIPKRSHLKRSPPKVAHSWLCCPLRRWRVQEDS